MIFQFFTISLKICLVYWRYQKQEHSYKKKKRVQDKFCALLTVTNICYELYSSLLNI
ncbi:hypothetical protein BY458DRAFT_499003 [Sporodiniella umbellata]|nr:hypothetical protein BY458DRAFT_499003 [Sporodiniella umbellata]